MQAMEATHVIVFAKAPHPGEVKTRLIPALGAVGAARLAHALLRHTLTLAAEAAPGRVILYCAPDASDPLLREAAAQTGAALAVQADTDLGGRMAAALAAVLRDAPRALLIGTDCPGLNAQILRQAAEALHEVDVVLIPALDGGYVLVGASQARFSTLPATLSAMFSDIAWSTAGVMAQTRERLVTLGWKWRELPPLADIDEAADLVHLPPGLGSAS